MQEAESKAAFTCTNLHTWVNFEYMQILLTRAKVFLTLGLHVYKEARVFLSKIGNCSLNNDTSVIS